MEGGGVAEAEEAGAAADPDGGGRLAREFLYADRVARGLDGEQGAAVADLERDAAPGAGQPRLDAKRT